MNYVFVIPVGTLRFYPRMKQGRETNAQLDWRGLFLGRTEVCYPFAHIEGEPRYSPTTGMVPAALSALFSMSTLETFPSIF